MPQSLKFHSQSLKAIWVSARDPGTGLGLPGLWHRSDRAEEALAGEKKKKKKALGDFESQNPQRLAQS